MLVDIAVKCKNTSVLERAGKVNTRWRVKPTAQWPAIKLKFLG
jgi:hypothetical protein